MGQAEISDILHEFKAKNKSSPMMQIADLLLYPICQGGYNPNYFPFAKLYEAAKLVDCSVRDPHAEGIKYYCFDITPKD